MFTIHLKGYKRSVLYCRRGIERGLKVSSLFEEPFILYNPFKIISTPILQLCYGNNNNNNNFILCMQELDSYPATKVFGLICEEY